MASRAFIVALLSSSALGDMLTGYGVLNAFETTVTTGVTVNSTAFGYVTTILDTAASTVTLSVGTTGITPTLAHIHGPSPAGVASGVLVPLNASNLNGTYAVTASQVGGLSCQRRLTALNVDGSSQVTALLAGKTYVNLHTSGQKSEGSKRGPGSSPNARCYYAAYPGGEIRAQLLFNNSGIAALTSAQSNNGTNAQSPLYGIASVFVTSVTTYTINLKLSDVTTVTAIHVHSAPLGINGPIVRRLPPNAQSFFPPLCTFLLFPRHSRARSPLRHLPP